MDPTLSEWHHGYRVKAGRAKAALYARVVENKRYTMRRIADELGVSMTTADTRVKRGPYPLTWEWQSLVSFYLFLRHLVDFSFQHFYSFKDAGFQGANATAAGATHPLILDMTTVTDGAVLILSHGTVLVATILARRTLYFVIRIHHRASFSWIWNSTAVQCAVKPTRRGAGAIPPPVHINLEDGQRRSVARLVQESQ